MQRIRRRRFARCIFAADDFGSGRGGREPSEENMGGFGSLYSEMDDDNFDQDRVYDADEVFKNFRKTAEDGMNQRAHRPQISRTAQGVIVETRKRRKVDMPY